MLSLPPRVSVCRASVFLQEFCQHLAGRPCNMYLCIKKKANHKTTRGQEKDQRSIDPLFPGWNAMCTHRNSNKIPSKQTGEKPQQKNPCTVSELTQKETKSVLELPFALLLLCCCRVLIKFWQIKVLFPLVQAGEGDSSPGREAQTKGTENAKEQPTLLGLSQLTRWWGINPSCLYSLSQAWQPEPR